MDNNKKVWLDNPWSDYSEQRTWGEIVEWANENVHETDRAEWMAGAKKAALSEDSKTLGAMIIGS